MARFIEKNTLTNFGIASCGDLARIHLYLDNTMPSDAEIRRLENLYLKKMKAMESVQFAPPMYTVSYDDGRSILEVGFPGNQKLNSNQTASELYGATIQFLDRWSSES